MPHIHEKIDYVSNIYIVHDGSVLLRKHDKHGLWFPPGGHVELDEDPPHAAVREAKEEVGMDVELIGSEPRSFLEGEKEILAPRFMDRHRINESHEHISFTFFARSVTREFAQSEGREVSDHIRWFTKEELDDPQYGVTEMINYYAKAALDALA
ncbi:MAG: hypothetical protein QOE22_532 [Candidatus Parcubacteria bacterium]|jgi:8-oxo-dGTP pyrophosphatase MutT (NUDIX family)|nr:hypothetical protein [Candidatus Parcubacteria bacterium]